MISSSQTELPKTIYAEAVVPFGNEDTIYDINNKEYSYVTQQSVNEYLVDSNEVEKARTFLREKGFKVSDSDNSKLPYLFVAGSPQRFKQTFGLEIRTREVSNVSLGKDVTVTHLVFDNQEPYGYAKISTDNTHPIKGITLSAPGILFQAASGTPPNPNYFHLKLPNDLASRLGAETVHDNNITGKNIRVAMIDTGHFLHPFFVQKGYIRKDVILTSLATDPNKDDHGHGTAHSANLYAIAPGVTLIPIKATPTISSNNETKDSILATTEALKIATNLDSPPDIITCSWGFNFENPNDILNFGGKSLEVAIAAAASKGIVVIFSGGNTGSRGFPADHPDVIAAGGVYMDENGTLAASNYATTYDSKIYPGRSVPDLCGLVGLKPSGRYLTLPVPAGSKMDQDYSIFDETDPDDGWAVFSGTSAAAPQIAGVVALMMQSNPALKGDPSGVKDILIETAVDVQTGSATLPDGNPKAAKAGQDLATGHGLVNAFAAVRKAQIRISA